MCVCKRWKKCLFLRMKKHDKTSSFNFIRQSKTDFLYTGVVPVLFYDVPWIFWSLVHNGCGNTQEKECVGEIPVVNRNRLRRHSQSALLVLSRQRTYRVDMADCTKNGSKKKIWKGRKFKKEKFGRGENVNRSSRTNDFLVTKSDRPITHYLSCMGLIHLLIYGDKR